MEKIISALILFVLGAIMVLFTSAMVRFQVWTQHTIMGAQYVPSKRTYTAVRIVGVFVLVLGLLVATGILHSSNAYVSTPSTPLTTTTPPPASGTSAVTYNNSTYGFTFSLPADWKGYSIVQSSWTGYPEDGTSPQLTGPKLLLRNPNWTAEKHYEDIPILIFTIAEWNSYQADDFSVSAAPIPASELARNNKYVFALPPRWDYDYSQGYQEAESILSTKPLHPFNL